MRLLLIEDDDRVAQALSGVLGRHGFAVRRAASVAAAAELLDDDTEVAILDLGLPDGDGLDLCKSIRAARDIPLIITTARADVATRVHGLHLGADDYLVKPFATSELIARIHAVVRRSPRGGTTSAAPKVVICRGLEIDLGRRSVRQDANDIALARKEFGVIAMLARDRRLVVCREQLLSQVWGSTWIGDQHTLDVHIAGIRAKCGDPGVIRTVRGVGYQLGDD